MKPESPLVLLVMATSAPSGPLLRELRRLGQSFRWQTVSSLGRARARVRAAAPAVILLDDSAAGRKSLAVAVRELACAAPVVLLAGAARTAETAALLDLAAQGRAQVVLRENGFLLQAAEAVARRLRSAARVDAAAEETFPARPAREFFPAQAAPAGPEASGEHEDFVAILRHEMNNPLTGILGNAELLLARRDTLPPAAVQRLETIAHLAVRLRETIRRLTLAWPATR